jgi:hypothetical protein
MNIDDGGVADVGHGYGHNETGELADNLPDYGRCRSGICRRGAVDREDALNHLPCPIVPWIESGPADVEPCAVAVCLSVCFAGGSENK